MVQLSHSNASKASIPPVSCTKDPGLLFQDTLKFNQNIANLAAKANKILGSGLKTIHSRYTYCIIDLIYSSLGCSVAIPQVIPEPLKPNLFPERARKEVHTEFKGPIAGKYYFKVMIDQYFKYPEVDTLKSTRFKKLRSCLDCIFSSQGIPEKVTADNGPPYPFEEMEKHAKEMDFKMNLTTPENQAANGFADILQRFYKLLHTSFVEGKDPQLELYKYPSRYQATPHPKTGLSSLEMLNYRKIRTKLPYWHNLEEGKGL